MKLYIISITTLLLISISSCQGGSKQRMIEQRIVEMQIENETLDIINKNPGTKQLTDSLKNDTLNDGDNILGIWEVNNDYYKAIYEIVKFNQQYFGKVHYYNDGTTEIKAVGGEKDFFLEDILYKDGSYTYGKMHLPDGSFYYVRFTLKGDELTVKMTIQGQPYTEVWKRQKEDKN
ncbi:MAG: hypothetical protein MI866_24180 [Bacteroidales bacterium]|nr:hypothetical protein [Bacteroidales bacterium]